MASYNYVDTPNSNLVCCICRMPFMEPTTTRTCFHTFCYGCIIRAIEHAPQCPVDRTALAKDDLLPANTIVRSLVDELVVECPHRSSGCAITCQRQLLASHLKDACQYTRISCSEAEGDELVMKDAGTECHNAECPEKTATCSSCSSQFPCASSAAHAATCPDIVVPCQQSSNGCPWMGPRRILTSTHILSCPYESIKGFFSLNNSRLAALTEENLLLKYKVETLDGMVHAMKREMQAVKTALGPWYRPDGAYRSPALPVSSDQLPEAQPSSSHQYTVHDAATRPLHVGSHDMFVPAIPPATANPDILAPYFPPATDGSSTQHQQYQNENQRQRHLQSTSISHLSDFNLAYSYSHHHHHHHHHQTLPHPIFPRPVSQTPTQTSIAPINLSTTLEGSLSSLRESIVTLSASMDSLARQHDIALTNETLKLNEEIMSLRASVHGLRMQVHTIMMDRNAQVTGRVNETWSEHRGSVDSGWPASMPARLFNHPPQAPASITKL